MTYVARSKIVELSEKECWNLLRRHQYGVGRVAFLPGGAAATDAPQILPVNYLVDAHDVIVQTGEGLIAQAAAEGQPMSLETDSFTQPSYGERGGGWSVLARGRAEMVTEAAQQTYLRLGHLAPAAGGFKPNFVRVVVEEISGRRI